MRKRRRMNRRRKKRRKRWRRRSRRRTGNMTERRRRGRVFINALTSHSQNGRRWEFVLNKNCIAFISRRFLIVYFKVILIMVMIWPTCACAT